jgi:hypothetical protein
MANTFKTLLGNDVTNTRTLLHEAIPITGTISSGTYNDNNIKTFSHGMFESVYDYPFLSSSANHIFDLTYGCSSNVSSSANSQNAKKLNIYNQMAQVLMGYDVSGNIRKFDSDGTLDDGATGRMDHCFFMNFTRLLTKDEIKKNSFRLAMWTSGTVSALGAGRKAKQTIGDYDSANEFRTSPAGDYGLLFTASAASADEYTGAASVGLVFYQAGVVVLTSSIFTQDLQTPLQALESPPSLTQVGSVEGLGAQMAQTGSTIQELADAFRHRIDDIDFNNTIELNSAVYFCRINHNEFNYSSNPTYVTGSKLRVKNNVNDLPVTYVTSVGLYSPDNELLAVAKLSEPIRKDPNTELTLRVRLDY